MNAAWRQLVIDPNKPRTRQPDRIGLAERKRIALEGLRAGKRYVDIAAEAGCSSRLIRNVARDNGLLRGRGGRRERRLFG